MTATTAPDLLAQALGLPRGGPARCCFCGAPAGADHYALPDSFTALDAIAAPTSHAICAGCRHATTATQGQSPDGKPWMWSWVITATTAERHALCAMLGRHRVIPGRNALRAACLSPPKPPYAIVLCDAGRTHTMYRAAVHRGGPGATLTLDGRVLRYEPQALAERVALCERVAAAFGIKAARDVLPVTAGRWAMETVELIEAWHGVLGEPLTEAAACLFPDPEKEGPCSANSV